MSDTVNKDIGEDIGDIATSNKVGEVEKLSEVRQRGTQSPTAMTVATCRNSRKLQFCKYCNLPFLGRSERKDHENTHSKDTPFTCMYCTHTTGTRLALQRHHQKRHRGYAPYLCLLCRTGFTNRKLLKKHSAVHVDPHPFSCNICHQTFFRAGKLRQNMPLNSLTPKLGSASLCHCHCLRKLQRQRNFTKLTWKRQKREFIRKFNRGIAALKPTTVPGILGPCPSPATPTEVVTVHPWLTPSDLEKVAVEGGLPNVSLLIEQFEALKMQPDPVFEPKTDPKPFTGDVLPAFIAKLNESANLDAYKNMKKHF